MTTLLKVFVWRLIFYQEFVMFFYAQKINVVALIFIKTTTFIIEPLKRTKRNYRLLKQVVVYL